MVLSPAMHDIVIAVGGAVGGAIATAVVSAIPRAWRGFKKDIEDEALHRKAERELAAQVGAQAVLISQTKDDLQGVADMVREQFKQRDERLQKRFEKLKLKDTALETMLTGELPRITEETEAVNE